MKTWAAMYSIIWLAFLEIMLVLFLPFNFTVNLIVHSIIGIGILGLGYTVFRAVRLTSCPDRIKRITKTTWNLAIFQAVLGILLAVGTYLSWGGLFSTAIGFLHVGNALAIITQASSSATAFDMWEEKEFLPVPAR